MTKKEAFKLTAKTLAATLKECEARLAFWNTLKADLKPFWGKPMSKRVTDKLAALHPDWKILNSRFGSNTKHFIINDGFSTSYDTAYVVIFASTSEVLNEEIFDRRNTPFSVGEAQRINALKGDSVEVYADIMHKLANAQADFLAAMKQLDDHPTAHLAASYALRDAFGIHRFERR